MDERVRPARPHHRLTEDGRRVREVLSYSRRGNRFTPNQAAAWAAHHERWVIPDEAVDRPAFSLADWFGREAPLVVEIGSGVGEATARLAADATGVRRAGLRGVAAGGRRHPVAPGRGRRRERPAGRRRRGLVASSTCSARARSPSCGPSSPTRGPSSGTTSAGWSPPRSPGLAASRLAPGATWRLATDWADYAGPDARRARRRAVAAGRPGPAVGGAADDPLRAQGPGRRPDHHRPRLRPGRRAGPVSPPAGRAPRRRRGPPRPPQRARP